MSLPTCAASPTVRSRCRHLERALELAGSRRGRRDNHRFPRSERPLLRRRLETPLTRLLCAALTALLAVTSAAAAGAGEPEWRHAHSLLGEPKYPAGFRHFDYVNPDAPKGGLVRLGVQDTFDNFNLFVAGVKGAAETGLPLIYDTLMETAQDEVGTEYGLLAEAVRHPPDNSAVTYRLRQEARWHDGRPVTAADVIFSFETLKANSPQYAFYYKNVAKAEETAAGEITFTFSEAGNRELPHIVGQLPVLPKHWWEGSGAGRAPPQPDRDHARAAARLRPLPPEELRRRPLRRLRARARLLGPRSAGEPRPAQSRRGPLRVLPRLDRAARGLQGRPLRLPGREQRPQLGDGLRLPGGAGGARRPGRIPGAGDRDDAGLRDEPAPGAVPGRPRAPRLQPRLRFRGHQPHDLLRPVPPHRLVLRRHRACLLRAAAGQGARDTGRPARQGAGGGLHRAVPEPGERLAREGAGEPPGGPAAAERGGLRAAGTSGSSTSGPASPSRSSSSATTRTSSASSCPMSRRSRGSASRCRSAPSTRRSSRTGCAASTST